MDIHGRTKLLKKIQYDCLVRILPTFPLSTMKKIGLLLADPSKVGSILLSADEVQFVCSALREEMKKHDTALSNISLSNFSQPRKDLRITMAVCKAKENFQEVSSCIDDIIKNVLTPKKNEFHKNLLETDKIVDGLTRKSMKHMATIEEKCSYLTAVTDKLNDLLIKETEKVQEETAQVTLELDRYKKIENFQTYLEEYNNILKAIKVYEDNFNSEK